MPKISGKTIDELLRANETDGTEIIPMSVYDKDKDAYVTRGITLNDLFKVLYDKIHETENNIAKTNMDLGKYTEEMRLSDAALNAGLAKTSSMVNANAAAIVTMNNDMNGLSSYTYTNVGDLDYRVSYLASYVDASGGAVIHETVKNLEELRTYTYNAVAEMETDQLRQDNVITQHTAAIGSLAASTSYNEYVNNIQSGRINTLYYSINDDSFDDFTNPDDDYVTPQK